MSEENIAWLYDELPKLVEKGVISKEAAHEIKSHYGPIKEEDKQQNLVLIFSILGAVLIGSGIILLLAHNWSELTRLSRTVIIFATLIGAQSFVAWVLLNKRSSVPWREGSATFLTFIVGAAIALIGQTYHLPSDLANFLLTWMLLIVPLVYLVDTTIPALIYLSGISWWSFIPDTNFRILFWLLAGLIVPYYIKEIDLDRTSRKVTILSWVLSLSLFLGIYPTLGMNSSAKVLLYLIYLGYFSSLFLLGQKLNLKTNALEGIGLVGVFAVLYTLGSFTELNRFFLKNLFSSSIYHYIILFSILGFNIYLLRENYIKGNKYNLVFGIAPFILLFSLLFSKIYIVSLLIYNAYFLLMALRVLFRGLEKKTMKLANLGILMIALQIIGRFFFLEISFIWRGIIFVAVGIGFLVSNIIMSRYLKE